MGRIIIFLLPSFFASTYPPGYTSVYCSIIFCIMVVAKQVQLKFLHIIDIYNFLQEAWYTPQRRRHSSSGWIEERFGNVRRSSTERASSSTARSTSKLLAATTGRKDGFAINLQMCKFVANLTSKFASTLQWLFYYLCYTKFAIHTLIPLHIRKLMGSNLHQICNDSFIMFTISNLHYLHSYLYTYANLWDQICIIFAMVVLLC